MIKLPRRRVLRAMLCCCLVCAAAVAAILWVLPWWQPSVDCTPPSPGELRDRHGVLLGYARCGEERLRMQPLPPGPLPDALVRAVLCAEDQHFYSHGGIDFLAVCRAVSGRLTGSSRSGASTVSMQLVKLSRPASRRTLGTKISETLAARRLEMEHDKDEILRAYLDRVDFGNGCRGAEAAAEFYFSRPAAELTLPQAALLAALIQAPSRLDPLRHPDAALRRVNRLLERMGEPAIDKLELKVMQDRAPRGVAPGRLSIDRGLQDACRLIARDEIEKLSAHGVSQAAVLIVHNPSGQILARIPAAFPESEAGGQLDGTRTRRSAGSTLKPLVYLLAFEKGFRPGSILADVPTLYPDSSGIEAPNNYNRRYLGPISIRKALACSQNVPALEVLNRSGGPAALMQMLSRFGICPGGSAEEYGLGLAIGNAHVTLEELARAYAALARGGDLPELRSHLREGEDASHPPAAVGRRVADERLCYGITDILSDSGARADAFGAGENLSFRFPCAAKTGTSSNYRDNWCIGYTGDYTVAVWVGNFDNSSMNEVSGISGAGPIFHRCMEELYSRRHDIPGPGGSSQAPPPLPESDAHSAALFGLNTQPEDIAAPPEDVNFPQQPEGMVRLEADVRTGLPATAKTPAHCRVQELALSEEVNRLRESAASSELYDAQGRVLLDGRYADWLAESRRDDLYAVDTERDAPRRLSILIPANGSRLMLDSSLPNDGRIIELISTLPPGRALWTCPTLPLRRDGEHCYAELSEGHHVIRVQDTKSGRSATSSFTVERLR